MNICYHCLRVNAINAYQCQNRHFEISWDEVKDFIDVCIHGWKYKTEKPKKFDDNRKLFLNEI